MDSLTERIIRDFGDFNNNGLKDLLTFFVRDGFIYEQNTPNSSILTEKFSDEAESFGRLWRMILMGIIKRKL